MTGLSEPLDKRRRRVRAVHPQPPVVEVLRLAAGPAAKLEHVADRHVGDDLLQKSGNRFGHTCRGPRHVRVDAVLVRRESCR